MSCEEMVDKISAYADGECGALEKIQVERHMALCSFCQKELLWAKSLKQTLQKIPQPILDENIIESLIACSRARPLKKKKKITALWNNIFLYKKAWGLAFVGACVISIFLIENRLAASRLPLDWILTAHNEYALTLPFTDKEITFFNLARHLQLQDSTDNRDDQG